MQGKIEYRLGTSLDPSQDVVLVCPSESLGKLRLWSLKKDAPLCGHWFPKDKLVSWLVNKKSDDDSVCPKCNELIEGKRKRGESDNEGEKEEKEEKKEKQKTNGDEPHYEFSDEDEESEEKDRERFGEDRNIYPFNTFYPPIVLPLPKSMLGLRPRKRLLAKMLKRLKPNTMLLFQIKTAKRFEYILEIVRLNRVELSTNGGVMMILLVEHQKTVTYDRSSESDTKRAIYQSKASDWISIPGGMMNYMDSKFFASSVVDSYILTRITKEEVERFFYSKTIEEGTTLYHGTRDESGWWKKSANLTQPLFFAFFKNDSVSYGTILEFRLKEDISVIDLTDNTWGGEGDEEGRNRLQHLLWGTVRNVTLPKELEDITDRLAHDFQTLSIDGWWSTDYGLIKEGELMVSVPNRHVEFVRAESLDESEDDEKGDVGDRFEEIRVDPKEWNEDYLPQLNKASFEPCDICRPVDVGMVRLVIKKKTRKVVTVLFLTEQVNENNVRAAIIDDIGTAKSYRKYEFDSDLVIQVMEDNDMVIVPDSTNNEFWIKLGFFSFLDEHDEDAVLEIRDFIAQSRYSTTGNSWRIYFYKSWNKR